MTSCVPRLTYPPQQPTKYLVENATAPQEMVEVEIREAPRAFPVLAPSHFALGPGSDIVGAAAARRGNGTLDLDLDAAAGVNGAGGKVTSFPDSASLSPDALFRAYLERERGFGGRNVSEEVRLRYMYRVCLCVVCV